MGLVFSSLLFEMSAVYSDSQIRLLQTYADQILLLWDACRASGWRAAGSWEALHCQGRIGPEDCSLAACKQKPESFSQVCTASCSWCLRKEHPNPSAFCFVRRLPNGREKQKSKVQLGNCASCMPKPHFNNWATGANVSGGF